MNSDNKIYRIFFAIVILVLSCLIIVSFVGINQTNRQDSYFVIDNLGYKTIFDAKPTRVLCYNLTQDTILLGIAPADYLVAKNYLDKDPAISYIAEETKNIKTEYRLFKQLGEESIMAMNPQVIFVPDTLDKNVIESYRAMGIKTVVCRGPNSIDDIRYNIRLMSQAMGKEENGDKLIREMDRQLAEVRDKIQLKQAEPPVVMLASRMRQYGGIGCVYDDICKHAGIRNAISMQGIHYGETVTKESIIASNPDVFLVSAGREYEEPKDVQFRKEFLEDPAFQHLKGMKRVIAIPDRYIYSNSQNCVYAIKGLYNSIYGPTFDMKEEKLLKGY